MPSPIKFAALSLVLLAGAHGTPWQNIAGSIGVAPSRILVVSPGQNGPTDALARTEAGEYLILEGESPLATMLGFRAGIRKMTIRSIVDARAPRLSIVWQRAEEVQRFEIPKEATVFATERWSGTPVLAGLRRGKGAILWMAVPAGERGYERFPYLLQALTDLGLEPALRSARLWAFFDSSYRMRVDLDYFAARWRKAGIGTLHVAAWHYNEPEPERDAYLRKLIDACHKQGILVYAWMELPHVSEKFWDDHPQWREKTALLQDAHLDWRKLMNLQNADCFDAVAKDTRALIQRFNWDGVNMAELYFESLEGASNRARFTPMNDDVRQAFVAWKNVDPVQILDGKSPELMKDFLSYRAGLARTMQKQWMEVVESTRAAGKPDLDVVLTHVDDRFDPRMRDLLGADAAKTLPMTESSDYTFLIEDPATIWNLGPERYSQIAERYAPISKRPEKLAIDINIVERYQDVYPTKQQTGIELFQLVHTAARAFPRVALYFENSILNPDWRLLPSAAAVVDKYEEAGTARLVESPRGVSIGWTGPATVNGKLWPALDGVHVLLPAGKVKVEPAISEPPVRLLDFNGELKDAAVAGNGMEFRYASSSRAIALLDRDPESVMVDGKAVPASALLMLPRGEHRVEVRVGGKK